MKSFWDSAVLFGNKYDKNEGFEAWKIENLKASWILLGT